MATGPQIIKIKSGSVRRNPTAGNTTFCITGAISTYVNDKGQFVQERPVEICHTLQPEPDFLYEYEPTLIHCDHCKAEFPPETLRADAYPNEDDEVWSNDICPKCGTWDCCEYAYEKPTEDMLPREPKP